MSDQLTLAQNTLNYNGTKSAPFGGTNSSFCHKKVGNTARDTDDSFASQFAPLPASTSSSCCLTVQAEIGTDSNELNQRPEERILSDKPLSGEHAAYQGPAGEMDSVDEIITRSQDLPLMLKLEQLREWQQHMQEQLRAHQLEELLHLQEEQQRLLVMAHGNQQGAADSPGSPGNACADWEESTLQEDSTLSHSPTTHTHPDLQSSPPLGPTLGSVAPREWRRGDGLKMEPRGEEPDWRETAGAPAWSRGGEGRRRGVDGDDATLSPRAARSLTEDPSACEEEETLLDSEDRPIHPGVGGQKQTFEELLEEQMRLEEQRIRTSQQQRQQSQEPTERMRANPKRAFLKRGEGLARFNGGKASLPSRGAKTAPKPQPQAKTTEPRTSQKTAVSQRPPVQRKTAVLNKENCPRVPSSPPLDSRPEHRAAQSAAAPPRVLGSHQRQNIQAAGAKQPDPGVRLQRQAPSKEASSRKTGPSAQAVTVTRTGNTPPRAVTKQVAPNDVKRAEGGKPASGGIPEYSFEVSFQEKLQRWNYTRQKESVELGEFELLEQAADELSFSSNSSFVMKVLQLDKQQHGDGGRHTRRLSSTPIKSPRPSPPERPRDGGGNRSSPAESGAAAEEAREDLRTKRGDDGEDEEDEEEEEDDDEGESRADASDVSLHSSSEFADRGAAGPSRAPTFPSDLCFSASKPPYDRRSYQDRDGEEGCGRAEEGGGDDGALSSGPDDSTLMEDEELRGGRLAFDDDDTWNDPEEEAGGGDSRRGSLVPTATANDLTPAGKTLRRKVAAAKGTQLDKVGAVGTANQEPGPPPASQLMARLFPSLKPKAQPAAPPPPVEKRTEEASGQQGQQSRQLRERLVELEMEIERFRTENATLTKLRQDNERSQESLRKERVEFDQRKVEELTKLEEQKREETRKLQRERRVFEKHASAARAVPDKKEREEIQSLKQQLGSLQEELRRRESRWSNTHSRLRQQIDSLCADNAALKEEVRTLERLRLGAWRSSGRADGEKKKKEEEEKRERKDKQSEGPGPSENGGALRTKVVTFSSPPEARSSLPLSCTSTRGSPTGSSPPLATGSRSSLKSWGPSACPVPGGPTPTPEERPQSGGRRQDTLPSQEHCHNLSPRAGGLNMEAEPREVKEQEVITHPDGKMESVLACGGRLTVFPNGTRKEVSADGQTSKVTFFNGDIKQVMGDQRVIYYYADAQTTHTTYPDGIQVLQFPNNQTEKHFPDGGKEITFPDQTVKNMYADGREETVLTDGTIILVNTDGSKDIQFNTGQREVHTAGYKRREYPDGTVKTVYTDGRQETRYPTGRIRVKDKDGNMVLDSTA